MNIIAAISEAGWMQIAGQIVGLIVTLATLWLTMHYKLKGVETKTEEIKTGVGEVNDKAAHIEKLTNSNLLAVKDELKTANGQIGALQRIVESLATRNGRVDVATRIVKVEEVVKVVPTKEP